jgi:hypothetical protein
MLELTRGLAVSTLLTGSALGAAATIAMEARAMAIRVVNCILI